MSSESKVINVLVFPAGEINSIELHDALSTCVNIKLYGASSIDRHGPYVFKNYISGLPIITDKNFLDEFNEILDKYSIDVVFPTHDSVAMFFAQSQKKIRAKVVGGDQKTAEICRDKQKMYDLFADQPFVPKVITNAFEPPLFAKPKVGQGSVGAIKINSSDDMAQLNVDEYVITEYLPGDEYTIDCLTDKDGKLQVVAPRSRDRLLAGVSVRGQNQPVTEEIKSIANAINQRLKFAGLWYFQIKKDETGRFKMLEISTRVAGSMCLTRAQGANLPLLSVYVAMGFDIEVLINDYGVIMDRSLISRYKIDYDYDTVYFDFDDTLVINDQVHPYSIMFLYQCQNAGKRVVLLTRHAQNLNETLRRFSIDKGLFDEIIHLKEDDHKITNIKPERAIFIDNAFKERKFVHDKFKIPVFDVDALEVLLDWRT